MQKSESRSAWRRQLSADPQRYKAWGFFAKPSLWMRSFCCIQCDLTQNFCLCVHCFAGPEVRALHRWQSGTVVRCYTDLSGEWFISDQRWCFHPWWQGHGCILRCWSIRQSCRQEDCGDNHTQLPNSWCQRDIFFHFKIFKISKYWASQLSFEQLFEVFWALFPRDYIRLEDINCGIIYCYVTLPSLQETNLDAYQDEKSFPKQLALLHIGWHSCV